MIRTQIQLTEEQMEALREMAVERDASMAELIRQAVDSWIRSQGALTRSERKRRAMAAAGRFRSGRPDLSTDHDRYLAEAYEG